LASKVTKRERIFKIIEKAKDGDTASAVFDWFLIVLICLNIVAVFLSSFDNINNRYNKLFSYFEYFSIFVFTIEYLLRLWTAPYKFPSTTRWPSFFSYVRFIFSFMGILDLCAILPFYIPFVIIDLRILRIFRLFRLLRIFKLTRYNKSFDLIGRVFKREKDKLLMTFFIVGILLLLASSVMYTVENVVQPEAFPNILATLWWAVVTLTTVGYGDVYPVTVLGKLLSGVISILGIILIALPSGIISSGFVKEYEDEKMRRRGRKIRKSKKMLINS
jgi:voltage-gated potassium channel